MRFLLDQGLPRSAARLLSARGHETVHAGDIGDSDAADSVLLARALADHRIIVTLDADFHAILALSGAIQPSVIRVRVEGLKGPGVCDLIVRIASQCAEELSSGAVVSAGARTIRVRRLPIG